MTERVNETIKSAIIKAEEYNNIDELEADLTDLTHPPQKYGIIFK